MCFEEEIPQAAALLFSPYCTATAYAYSLLILYRLYIYNYIL